MVLVTKRIPIPILLVIKTSSKNELFYVLLIKLISILTSAVF